MSTVIVDWLGRGGIAQSSRCWARALSGEGAGSTVLVSRTDRELVAEPEIDLDGVASHGPRLVTHARLAHRAAAVIRARRPDTVVIQNYVVPLLEATVARAARRVGARLVTVVHDHRLHPGTAGLATGLGALVDQADVVVCHSRFVAQAISESLGRRRVELVPLVLPLPSDDAAPSPIPETPGHPLAVHFGMLAKAYKGAGVVERLAPRAEPWRFAFAGPGAPLDLRGGWSLPGFLPEASLVALLRRADAVILPYSFATQSGAVHLAQACGAGVVASAVGGIPEQVDHGRTGLLVAPDAPDAAWLTALAEMADPVRRRSLTEAARQAVAAAHVEFAEQARSLAA